MARSDTTEASGRPGLLCIGCGVCAAVCPAERIEMLLAGDGCYTAMGAREGCPEGCGMCRNVCPFGSTAENEDAIGKSLYAGQREVLHRAECGYYLSCVSGYSADADQRLKSASGGLATAFLRRLFVDKLIDGVVCVTRNPGSNPLFQYSRIDDVSELATASKSAYYPVDLGGVLRKIMQSDARHAVVCLPCVAKALRLAQAKVPRLKNQIVAVLGLICGHGVSSYFAEFACGLAGAPVDAVTEVVFRTKTASLPATELGTLVRWAEPDGGQLERTVLWSEGLGEAWSGHWFTPRACFFCDDVFAECADVAFMDAWLPDFVDDYRGTSLAIVRSKAAADVLDVAAAAGDVCLADIPVERVVESQELVVLFKREKLAHRLWRAAKMRVPVPVKRVRPRRAAKWYSAMQWDAEAGRASTGLSSWKRSPSLDDFRNSMRACNGELPPLIRARRFARSVLNHLPCGGRS